MKALKLLLTLFLFIGLASCSDDDDSKNSSEGDRIVGEWRMQSSSYDGEEYIPNECEAQSSIKFFSNGTVTFKEYWEEWETEECISETGSEEWEYIGNNIYKITDEDDDVNTFEIKFSNNNKTFTVTEEDEDGVYTVVYNKV